MARPKDFRFERQGAVVTGGKTEDRATEFFAVGLAEEGESVAT